jgi:Methyltransferase domain
MMYSETLRERALEQVYAVVEKYYADRVSKHGATPFGVDWTCIATQELRFVQLLKICKFTAPFSLNDVGCGYGAALAYLAKRHASVDIDYLGLDLSSGMINHAAKLYGCRSDTQFLVAHVSPRLADYSIASGIFNVKLDQPLDIWERFIARTIKDMSATSRRGFSVNFIAPEEAVRNSTLQLYRTSPEPWVRFCERELGCTVEIISDYGLREITLLIQH